MKRRIEIIVLLIVVSAGIGILFIAGPSSPEGKEEWGFLSNQQITTIRNLTYDTIHYSISSPDSTKDSSDYSLDPGEIHRMPAAGALEINFERNGEEDSYLLQAGAPYTFRYDANYDFQIYQGTHGRSDAADLAPYVATPMEIVNEMLELAEVSETDILYDLGCGDGRIVIMAAKRYGAKGVGVEIDSRRIRECQRGAREAGVEDKVRFILEDATKVDFSEATIITIYLLPESNEILRPLFERYLKPGTRIVSHNYFIPGWDEKEITSFVIKDHTGEEHSLFLYRR